MKQLGILDAAFVNLEQSNTPQHVGGLGIYDPSTAPGGLVRFKQVINNFERRLDSHPLFRTRLIEVPGGLDRPYWVKDANFDVEFHLRHIALPDPGDWRQLCIQVARLHSRPIDMSRPLWEAYIIEGLDNVPNLPPGCFAVYTKMHHALVDGAGGSTFMTLLHDLSADAIDIEEPMAEPRLVDTQPTTAELLSRATFNSIKNSVQMTRGALRGAGDLGKYLLDIARKEIPSPDVSAPRSILNKPVGPHRVFEATEFSLADFRAIKTAANCKVNDVALAVVSGGLRHYLEAKGELPEKSLAAAMPINLRTRRGATEDNNQVGSVFAAMHTDIADPVERLRTITESTAEAKLTGEASPLVDILKLAGAVPPAIVRTAASLWSRNQLSRLIPLNISTVISNVPGPDFSLYCAGARMVDYYGLGVLTPGVGLFHLVFSYSGKITMSVLADRDIMPDPEFYRECLERAYAELYAAVLPDGQDSATAAKAKVTAKVTASTRPKTKTRASTAPKARVKAKVKAKAKAASTSGKQRTGAAAKAKRKASTATRPKSARKQQV